MKRILIAMMAMAAVWTGCAAAVDNYPLPQGRDTLRILGLGNSFTDDGMMRLPEVLDSAGVHNVILGRMYIGGCSLERHVDEYANDRPAYVYSKSGADNQWRRVSDSCTSRRALRDEPWDVVVIQQVSGLSGLRESLDPWLDSLMSIVRRECANPHATIAWQQTWAYADGSQHPDYGNYSHSQARMYGAIEALTAYLKAHYPIEVVIPTGETIQGLRHRLPDVTGRQHTRDGYHLGYGLPRYEAARTWYRTLIQ